MSTEQEISGAGRKALEAAREQFASMHGGIHPSDLSALKQRRRDFTEGWLASREFGRMEYMVLVEVKRDLEKQVRELTHRLDIALEHEVACAEQRQRADVAEEREKKLREKIARAAAALVYLAPALDALGVALLHGDPLAELRVRFSDLIPEIEKAVDILSDADVS